MIKALALTNIEDKNQYPITVLYNSPNIYENIKIDYKSGQHSLSEFFYKICPINSMPDILVCKKTQELIEEGYDYGSMLVEYYEFFSEDSSIEYQNFIKLNKVQTRRMKTEQRQYIIDNQIETAPDDIKPFVLDLFKAWEIEIIEFVNFGTSTWRNKIITDGCPIAEMTDELWLIIKEGLLSLEI